MANIGDILGLLKDDTPSGKRVDKGKIFVRDTCTWLEDTFRERDNGSVEGYLRASGIHETCGRREAIFNWAPHLDQSSEATTAGRRITLDVGHQAHKWWQNRYLGPRGVLWGDWCCIRCSPLTDGGALLPRHRGRMPKNCPNCSAARMIGGQENIVFAEMLVKDDDLRYSGHPDGLLVEPPNTKPTVLLEIKTIANSRWDGLCGPETAHRFQIHVYMRSIGVSEALVVYLDKGKQADWSYSSGRFYARNPHIKAFHVEFDLRFWGRLERRLRDYNRARALMSRDSAVDSTNVETFPRVCESVKCKLAAGCPAKTECFRLGAPCE
jgi:hypothetical protein